VKMCVMEIVEQQESEQLVCLNQLGIMARFAVSAVCASDNLTLPG
jgi:hypothetical protein